MVRRTWLATSTLAVVLLIAMISPPLAKGPSPA